MAKAQKRSAGKGAADRKAVASLVKASPKERIQDFVTDAQELADTIASTLDLKKGTVLDAGCGGAYLDIVLAQKFEDLDFILLDPSAKAIAAAKENLEAFGLSKRATFIKCTEEDIDLDDESVDFAISTSSIGSWHNKQQGLEELQRVLKVGGRAYVTGINWDSYRDYFGMLKQAGLHEFSLHNIGDTMWIETRKVKADLEGDDD